MAVVGEVYVGVLQECELMADHNLLHTLPGAVCLYLAQILSTSYFIFRTSTIAMQREPEVGG